MAIVGGVVAVVLLITTSAVIIAILLKRCRGKPLVLQNLNTKLRFIVLFGELKTMKNSKLEVIQAVQLSYFFCHVVPFQCSYSVIALFTWCVIIHSCRCDPWNDTSTNVCYETRNETREYELYATDIPPPPPFPPKLDLYEVPSSPSPSSELYTFIHPPPPAAEQEGLYCTIGGGMQ